MTKQKPVKIEAWAAVYVNAPAVSIWGGNLAIFETQSEAMRWAENYEIMKDDLTIQRVTIELQPTEQQMEVEARPCVSPLISSP